MLACLRHDPVAHPLLHLDLTFLDFSLFSCRFLGEGSSLILAFFRFFLLASFLFLHLVGFFVLVLAGFFVPLLVSCLALLFILSHVLARSVVWFLLWLAFISILGAFRLWSSDSLDTKTLENLFPFHHVVFAEDRNKVSLVSMCGSRLLGRGPDELVFLSACHVEILLALFIIAFDTGPSRLSAQRASFPHVNLLDFPFDLVL